MKLRTHVQEQEVRAFAEKIAPFYELFNWKWYDGLPTPERIERSILDLLHNIDGNITGSQTGGLVVEKDEEGTIQISWRLEKAIWLHGVGSNAETEDNKLN